MPLPTRYGTAALAAALALGASGALWAQQQGGATPEEVVDRVKQAARQLAREGEAGLDAFRDKDSDYVWKDSYVFVVNCDEGTMAAHPIRPELEGQPLTAIPAFGDKSPEQLASEMCEAGRRPEGGWVEYAFPKPGEDQPSRKVSYDLAVEGTPYVVGAGVYDEDTTVEELERISGGDG